MQPSIPPIPIHTHAHMCAQGQWQDGERGNYCGTLRRVSSLAQENQQPLASYITCSHMQTVLTIKTHNKVNLPCTLELDTWHLLSSNISTVHSNTYCIHTNILGMLSSRCSWMTCYLWNFHPWNLLTDFWHDKTSSRMKRKGSRKG